MGVQAVCPELAWSHPYPPILGFLCWLKLQGGTPWILSWRVATSPPISRMPPWGTAGRGGSHLVCLDMESGWPQHYRQYFGEWVISMMMILNAHKILTVIFASSHTAWRWTDLTKQFCVQKWKLGEENWKEKILYISAAETQAWGDNWRACCDSYDSWLFTRCHGRNWYQTRVGLG